MPNEYSHNDQQQIPYITAQVLNKTNLQIFRVRVNRDFSGNKIL